MSSTNTVRAPGVHISGSSDGGGGGGGANNFSFKRVAPSVVVTIPADQQMLEYGGITIEGSLVIIGELVLLPIPVGAG